MGSLYIRPAISQYYNTPGYSEPRPLQGSLYSRQQGAELSELRKTVGTKLTELFGNISNVKVDKGE